jgi:hypothetical protein
MTAVVLDIWSELPQPVQQTLFVRALVLRHRSARDENLREQLAQFLHDHHERTANRGAGPTRAV